MLKNKEGPTGGRPRGDPPWMFGARGDPPIIFDVRGDSRIVRNNRDGPFKRFTLSMSKGGLICRTIAGRYRPDGKGMPGREGRDVSCELRSSCLRSKLNCMLKYPMSNVKY